MTFKINVFDETYHENITKDFSFKGVCKVGKQDQHAFFMHPYSHAIMCKRDVNKYLNWRS